MEELKPCPFCGGEAVTEIMVAQMGYPNDIIEFDVYCSKCYVRKITKVKIDTGSFSDIIGAMNNVIEKWNTRAE